MAKIDIISGFLGAGKTTLIQKLLKEALKGEKVVLIENEFGEIGIDGGFLKDAGIEVTEMNSGCICCSLVGDFGSALKEVVTQYNPDRIIIEPSGVGKLSDVIKAVQGVAEDVELDLNSFVTVADAKKCKMYIKNFGEFYNNQVEYAGSIILSRTGDVAEDKLNESVALLREHNEKAAIITTPWDALSGEQILKVMEDGNDMVKELLEEEEICPVCGGHHDHEHHHDHDHEHHHHDHDEECSCGCGHDHDHDHEHHHHDHDEECSCGCGHDHDHDHEHHHHDHDEECSCGCGHDHDHHHHHHADEVFTSWGKETPKKYNKEELDTILQKLSKDDSYGMILRSKGILQTEDGSWVQFDLVPGEYEIREGSADYTGRICVIGSKLKEDELEDLFF
ncbi:MAG: GTP-binding protein [Anaerostipes hadrus]|nr:GTP-binding protein [Anaerostipes hadrus]